MRISPKTTAGKLLASAGLVATAAAVSGLGTYGSFTSSTSASAQVDSGSVAITLDNNGANLSIPASGVLPGDTIERVVSLTNSGDQSLSGVTLTTTATKPSLLTTDKASGLQISIESCSVAWTDSAPYGCRGTVTTVLDTTPVLGTDRALTGLSSINVKGTDFLKVTETMPSDAPNTFQGLSDTVNFAFTATQRTPEAK